MYTEVKANDSIRPILFTMNFPLSVQNAFFILWKRKNIYGFKQTQNKYTVKNYQL
jgi:hypothetical protein